MYLKELAKTLVFQSAIKRQLKNKQRILKRSQKAAEMLGFIFNKQCNQPKSGTFSF